ncbi:MAG: hypothetical protein K6F32_03970 [Bacilli bacterium]|nr:hypothetical protein [Bacilli bacterium]
MSKKKKRITNPDELSKTLSYSSPATWVVLISVVIALAGFLVWSFVYTIQVKVTGTATLSGGVATLRVKDSDLKSLKEGQKVYISDLEGEIVSFTDNQPVVSSFDLNDGEYSYYVVVDEIKPIEFWVSGKRA